MYLLLPAASHVRAGAVPSAAAGADDVDARLLYPGTGAFQPTLESDLQAEHSKARSNPAEQEKRPCRKPRIAEDSRTGERQRNSKFTAAGMEGSKREKRENLRQKERSKARPIQPFQKYCRRRPSEKMRTKNVNGQVLRLRKDRVTPQQGREVRAPSSFVA